MAGFHGLLEFLGLWPSKPAATLPCLTAYVTLVSSATGYAVLASSVADRALPTGSATSALEGC